MNLTLAASNLSPKVAVLRRHVALVRALLEELDRILPSPGTSDHVELVAEQLIEELGRLGCRILECTGTVQRPASEPPSGLRLTLSPPKAE